MPCNISIGSVVGINDLCSGNFLQIEVTGTVSGCTNLEVSIACVPFTGQQVTVPAIINGGNFSAIIPASQLSTLPCGIDCGSDIQVSVDCLDPGSNCTDKVVQTLTCVDNDCACISFWASVGNCNPDGTRAVTIFASHTTNGYSPAGTIIDFGDNNQSSPFTFTPSISPTPPHSFTHNYQPGSYTVELQRPGCPPAQIQITVPSCNPCQDPVIGNSVGNSCNSIGQRTVTLVATLLNPGATAVNGSWDFGDGSPAQAIVLSPPNFQTIITHNYSPGTYTATLTLPNCPPETMTVVVPNCPSCCPTITNVDVETLGCNDDCERKVRITTEFESPDSGCPEAILEWRYYDNNNNLIATSNAFGTLGNSPFVDTQFFDPALSPIQAQLVTLTPNGCPPITETITLDPCTNPADCPQFSNPAIEHEILDCVERDDKCCRKVKIKVNGDFSVSCDPNQPLPRIRIDYDDGNYDERDIQFAGQQQVVFENEYCTAGNYTVQVTVLNPQGCSGPAPYTFSVPECNPDECDSTPTPDPDPLPCETGFLGILCRILRVIGTAALFLGIVVLLFIFCLGDPTGGVATTIAIASLAFGIAAMVFIGIFCRQCLPCGFIYLTLWKILLGIGLLLLIFSGCDVLLCINLPLWQIGVFFILLSILFLIVWLLICKQEPCQLLFQLIEVLSWVLSIFLWLKGWSVLANCIWIIFTFGTTQLTLPRLLGIIMLILIILLGICLDLNSDKANSSDSD